MESGRIRAELPSSAATAPRSHRTEPARDRLQRAVQSIRFEADTRVQMSRLEDAVQGLVDVSNEPVFFTMSLPLAP